MTAAGGIPTGLAALAAVLAAAIGGTLAAGVAADAVGAMAAICGLAAAAGWIAPRWPSRSPAGAVSMGLAGIVLRLLPPLATLAWLSTDAGARLRAAAAGELLVFFYLTMLGSDIALTMASSPRVLGKRGRNQGN